MQSFFMRTTKTDPRTFSDSKDSGAIVVNCIHLFHTLLETVKTISLRYRGPLDELSPIVHQVVHSTLRPRAIVHQVVHSIEELTGLTVLPIGYGIDVALHSS